MHWLVPRLAGSSTELGRWPLLAVVIHRFVSLTPPSSPFAFTDPTVGMVEGVSIAGSRSGLRRRSAGSLRTRLGPVAPCVSQPDKPTLSRVCASRSAPSSIGAEKADACYAHGAARILRRGTSGVLQQTGHGSVRDNYHSISSDHDHDGPRGLPPLT